MIDNVEEKYGVGALMYSPALNRKIAELVINGALGDKMVLSAISMPTERNWKERWCSRCLLITNRQSK